MHDDMHRKAYGSKLRQLISEMHALVAKGHGDSSMSHGDVKEALASEDDPHTGDIKESIAEAKSEAMDGEGEGAEDSLQELIARDKQRGRPSRGSITMTARARPAKMGGGKKYG